MKLGKYITCKNDRRLLGLSILLFLPAFLDFLTAWRNAINSDVTMAIYAIIGIFILCYSVNGIKFINILPIVIYWSFFLLNKVSYPENAKYFTSTPALLSTFFFFPISAVVVFRIDNWDNFLKIFEPFALVASLLGVYIVFFSTAISNGKGEFFSYMDFSYDILPSTLACYCIYRKKQKLFYLIAFALSLFSIINFGARAAVILTLGFTFSYEICAKTFKIWKVFLVLAIAGLLIVNMNIIVDALLRTDYFSDSRTLSLFVNNEIFSSSGRDIISESCMHRISEMGTDFSGMFGDRQYLNGAIYPHNIIYEVLMQYGWILGMLFLLYVAYLMAFDFFVKQYRLMTLYIVFALFGRYLISGSYLIEGKFWILIFMLLSIKVMCKKKNTHETTNIFNNNPLL